MRRSGAAPCADRRRIATSNAVTVRSTAGTTNGATHTGTPSRRASVNTLPNPNKNVSPTTIPTIVLTADTTGSRRSPTVIVHTTPRRGPPEAAEPGDRTRHPRARDEPERSETVRHQATYPDTADTLRPDEKVLFGIT